MSARDRGEKGRRQCAKEAGREVTGQPEVWGQSPQGVAGLKDAAAQGGKRSERLQRPKDMQRESTRQRPLGICMKSKGQRPTRTSNRERYKFL